MMIKTRTVVSLSIFLSFLCLRVSSSVTCPGQPSKNYCDCEGDCTGQPDWCACEEAQKCCDGATPTVLCPGQPQENYCDCGGDCKNQPLWCACVEARACCNSNNGDDVVEASTNDLQLTFNRYSGSDGKMNHEEWEIFVRHSELLSYDVMFPAVKLVLKNGGDNYADCDGEYPLLFGERWNEHEVYVNKTKDRILMFRRGSWLVTGYHWWDDFKRTGGEGMGGGFHQSKLGATDSIKDSKWDNYNVTLGEVQVECTDDIERNRTDSIWDDVSGNKLFFSFDHFLTALGKIALDRKDKYQDRNTIREIYQWIVKNHANEEHKFCHKEIDDEAANSNIVIRAFDGLMFGAFFFACGVFFGLVSARSVRRDSTSYLPLTPPENLNKVSKNHQFK